MEAEYISNLEGTLRQTLVPDSGAVKNASNKLTKELYPNSLALPSLFHILHNAQDTQLKQLAAVEVRKLVLSKWENLDTTMKSQIRDSILRESFSEPSKALRHQVARVIAAIGEIDLEAGEWQDLLPFLVNSILNSNQQAREMAVYILYSLLETHISALSPHMSDFVRLFTELLSSSGEMEIKVNAVLSLDVVAQYIEEEAQINDALAAQYQNTIPGMVNVLKEVVAKDDVTMAKDVFNVFHSIIFFDNKLVGDHLFSLIQVASEVSANVELDEEYRTLGLQFLISCVSLRKSKISSFKLGPDLTLLALKIASEEIDVDEEVNNELEENENEENMPPSLALRLISVLSAELAPSQVMSTIFDNLHMMSSSNPFERRAELLSIGVASAGAPEYLSTQVGKVVPAIIVGLKDPEIVVRVAALKTLSQLTSELQDTIAEYHREFLPELISIIDSATTAVTYKYSCYALDGLVEFVSHDAIGDFLQPLMDKLLTMLQQANSSSLKSAIVSAIGSTAYAAGKRFTPFFEVSVKELGPIIGSSVEGEGVTEDDIELKALSFENVSTMARAMGSNAFSNYAKPLVEAAYSSLGSQHSRIRESGFAFISNMAKVYGSEFAGFLDQLVPQILNCLNQEEFTFNVNEEDELEDEDEGLENKFNVHTGITIEKEIASVALSELALGTGKAFANYVEPSVNILTEQIDNSYGMREACMNALWKIAKAMYKAQMGDDFKFPKGVPQQVYVDDSLLQLIRKIRDVGLTILEEEFELTMVACILDNFSEGLVSMGPIVIIDSANSSSYLEKMCVQLMQILKNEHSCQIDDEEEADDGEDTSEMDALLFDSTLEVLVDLAVTLGADFNKIFGSFKDIIISHLKTKSRTKRVSIIGALAEISAGLQESNAYVQELLQVFTDRLANDKSLEVRGNAAYGIGILIEHSSVDVSATYGPVLQLLYHLLSKTDEKASADDVETKDVVNRLYANACGCVARMALKNELAVPLEHIMTPLLSHLPLQNAFEENTPILLLIVRLYETNNSLIMSKTDAIVSILALIFEKDLERVKLVNESTLGREENIDRMKQFPTEGLKEKVILLLKFLDTNFNGIVSSNMTLKMCLEHS